MIRFKIIGGDYLELPSDFSFQFQFNNGLFAFENMQLSRSGEFTIPDTPKNNMLLEFGNNPSNDGYGVRKKKLVELHYSGGKIQGSLFFGKYSKGYSAIFVYGELEVLKNINEKGTIKNYVSMPQVLSTASIAPASPYSATGVLSNSFYFYNYNNGIADANKLVNYINLQPTVKLKTLLDAAASASNVNIDYTTIGTAKDAIGIILSTQNSAPTVESAIISGTPTTATLTGASGFLQMGTMTFKWKSVFSTFPTWHNKTVRIFAAKQDITIKLTSGSIIVANGDGRSFVGDGYNKISYAYGAGSEFQLKKGEYFAFVSMADYFFETPYNKQGSSEGYVSNFNVVFDIWAGGADTLEKGESFPLQQNLPEVTFVDILKTYANLFKCGIDYNSLTNTISFFNFNFDRSNAIVLDERIIEIKEVDRTFLGYARKNTIEYKSEDHVTTREKLTYSIDNDNIQDEKVLYTIPFSEGNKSGFADVLVSDFELAEPYKLTAKNGTICVATKRSSLSPKLAHISRLYDNFTIADNLTSIIFNSTTISLQVKMTANEFLSLTNKQTFKYRGKFYVCLNGNHSGNSAELNLIKI